MVGRGARLRGHPGGSGGAFLREYGLNIWAFAAVEIASSALLATAGGRLIGSFAHTTRGRRGALGLATLTAYAAPDVYVLVFAGQFPTGTLVVVVGVIAVGAVASILSVVVQLRKARLAAAIVR